MKRERSKGIKDLLQLLSVITSKSRSLFYLFCFCSFIRFTMNLPSKLQTKISLGGLRKMGRVGSSKTFSDQYSFLSWLSFTFHFGLRTPAVFFFFHAMRLTHGQNDPKKTFISSLVPVATNYPVWDQISWFHSRRWQSNQNCPATSIPWNEIRGGG